LEAGPTFKWRIPAQISNQTRATIPTRKTVGTMNFVIPYPPGFPVMVPGQVIVSSAITCMHKLGAKEIHGYHAA
jgi:arginine/lysine/ornithine decarboxylase